jgi:dihydrodipicolinate reductase
MKVIILGASGEIGREIIRALEKDPLPFLGLVAPSVAS